MNFLSTSKFLNPKQGPTTAITFLLFIFLFANVFIPSLQIFVRAPFHPACRQQINFFSISNKNTGAQSAVKTPMAIFFSLVTKPSP